ncbi:Ca(2+)-dependent cysteine protease [Mortierella sp. NVP85]|nr:Ca(2+)-dependent cysteine protease [Mortierella sp. NVP85]
MSQPREVGEPVVKVEKVETVLPDGRKVIKTIKKITKSYQMEVPAGTPLPEGARIVSTSAAEVPADNTVVTHYQTSSTSSGDSDNLRPEDLQHVTSEPTVVVQTIVDDNGRKVTKTTTTTSSSNAGGPLSKLFKRFSLNSGKKEKKSDSKPLPSIPPQQVKAQVVKSESKPAASEPAPEIANLAVQTLEYKRPDGKKIALSDCTGDRRAVLIGINYVGGANPLNGYVNDTAVMKAFLLEKGFKEENIRVLTDAGQHNAKLMPTRDNILHHLKWLVHDPKKNDSRTRVSRKC